MYQTLLALVLLTLPPNVPSEEYAQFNTPEIRQAMQVLAVEWEILDPREVRYVGVRPEDFINDLNLLRKRWDELKDAPLAMDAMRFPERTVVNDFLSFNRAYRQHLDMQRAMCGGNKERWWDCNQAVQETDQLYALWDTVRDARCEYYYVTVRRQALLRLRDSLGEQKYYEGSLPPYVPLWRFQEIR